MGLEDDLHRYLNEDEDEETNGFLSDRYMEEADEKHDLKVEGE